MARLGYLRGDGMELILCEGSEISYPRHSHVSSLVLGFVLEGAVELVTDGGSRLFRAGGSFTISPYTPHRVNARSRYTMLTLCAGVDGLSGPAFKEDAAAFLRGAVGDPELEERIIRAVWALKPSGGMPPGANEPAIIRLRARLERYPERGYTIDDMARAALVSKYELIRAFKREVGLTPHQFQIQNRVRMARLLLEETATMTEAALAAGFCDQSHFIRHFKRSVGLTPTEYRLACGAVPPLLRAGPG